MIQNTRRLIFYALLLIFCLATPPIIFYAAGYSFDWQKKTIVKTGGLYLKSLPTNAQILIDGQNKKTTPRLIARLRPGTHNISVNLNDYYGWEKKLEIRPGLVTEARNIILFPRNTFPEKITDGITVIDDFFLTPEEKYQKMQAVAIASSTAGWLFRQNNLFIINSTNYILYRSDLNGYIREQISKEFLPPDHYQIIAHDNQFLVLGEKSGFFRLKNDSGLFEKIADNINGAAFSDDGKKIIYWSDNEIWLHYLENILIQPYKQAGEKELITRHSQSISQAIFYPDNEHIAYVVNDQIKIIETDERDRRNTINFINASQPQIYFSATDKRLYYLTVGRLYRVKLDF